MSGTGITQTQLFEALDYDPATGLFRWKTERPNAPNGSRTGTVAGSPTSNGYWRIWLFGKDRAAHQLAWLWMTGEWPSRNIDHKNLNRSDNAWENLRLTTPSQNAANQAPKRTKGWPFVKGVSFHGHLRSKPFRAQIEKDGVNYSLGYHSTVEAAKAAYDAKAIELFGNYARVA